MADCCPVRWTGQQAIVTLPEHMDVANAGRIREELLSVINRGALTLIADMTSTVSCDHAGADAVVRAYQRAVISGAELRLVVAAPIVWRVLSVSGVDRLVSIYPSLEAATVPRTPVALPLLVAGPGPGRVRTNGQAPPRGAGRASRPARAATPADGTLADITPAVMQDLVDALPDGVALADHTGILRLASRRLADMFGYGQAELPGQSLDSLIPAYLQAARHNHRAAGVQTPAVRPVGTGVRLAGLRKDGTTFPADISISPIATAAGSLTLTVIRDVTGMPQPAGPAGLTQADITTGQEHRGRELFDSVITSLFHIALSLQSATDLPVEVIRQRIAEALERLDDSIGEIRETAFRTRDHHVARPHRP